MDVTHYSLNMKHINYFVTIQH